MDNYTVLFSSRKISLRCFPADYFVVMASCLFRARCLFLLLILKAYKMCVVSQRHINIPFVHYCQIIEEKTRHCSVIQPNVLHNRFERYVFYDQHFIWISPSLSTSFPVSWAICLSRECAPLPKIHSHHDPWLSVSGTACEHGKLFSKNIFIDV